MAFGDGQRGRVGGDLIGRDPAARGSQDRWGRPSGVDPPRALAAVQRADSDYAELCLKPIEQRLGKGFPALDEAASRGEESQCVHAQ
jgi:hypothetical protein